MLDQSVTFDSALIRKYDTAGPRYTSYPTAPQFHPGFDADALQRQIAATNAECPQRPLSLYFHIPFCDTVCFYCACNKVVTKDRSKAGVYLQHLFREIELLGGRFDPSRPVTQLHWGGGTPTFLSGEEMRALMAQTRRHFTLLDDDAGEYSIEIDPREVEPGTLALLRELGFNRLSLGVQDLDPAVQRAVNRIQSEELTFGVLEEARRLGFRSVSVDLIYGLPLQTEDSFAHTLARVIAARPDRLAIFNYAHLPERFKPQRRINAADLPSPEAKLAILARSMEQLAAAGYVYIGMDHFALPEDELARAQREGTLHRNFQGYSTHADCDLVAMGVTAISQVGDSYSQNVHGLDEYYARLAAGQLPVAHGIELSRDDRLRRNVITRLICDFSLDFAAIERQYGIVFANYFTAELQRLRDMAADGLLRLEDGRIDVLPRGRLLIRNICMVFDVYLRRGEPVRFSKVI
ncbi:MAG: oxygen-independent coproporphyrinogen III oxidase [Pseudomonadota bacterium]|uniref:oxygen-independent coproporphyrinogen III oxidase n=1 Tax=Thermithiobacillus tepidarius TaxID=929 RepID=UPI0004131525|nr:oxygen-independent coproporphyrinogen III oxidase [Thermithiobacillus tepidarius]